jgi:ferredoxin
MSDNPYQRLATRLNELPDGFPPTESGVELRLLAKLFSPEEAKIAAVLYKTPEPAGAIAERAGIDRKTARTLLKGLGRRGMITIARIEGGLGYALMPFAVGFYEHQYATIDAEFAQLFEAYYQEAFPQVLTIGPPIHRVVPVGESIQTELEIQSYESVVDLVNRNKSWGVVDCICRKQKALIGEGCDHPLDVCMTLDETEGAYDNHPHVRALTREEALATLRRAAEAGLVHSVSNTRHAMWDERGFGTYICNCCTCSCGILRGLAESGAPAVVARSSFICQVDEALCIACGECEERCPFGAIAVDDLAAVDGMRCVGCGVCTLACPQGALELVRRPEDEITPVPENEAEWERQRAVARGMDPDHIL